MSNFRARKPRDWFTICSWIALIVVFAALVLYMGLHGKDLLDADMSSELVLAQQLKQTGGILSSNWYYSTEVRVLNTQLVYSLLFHAFDDWQTVRLVGNITLYLVLLGSYYFFLQATSHHAVFSDHGGHSAAAAERAILLHPALRRLLYSARVHSVCTSRTHFAAARDAPPESGRDCGHACCLRAILRARAGRRANAAGFDDSARHCGRRGVRASLLPAPRASG